MTQAEIKTIGQKILQPTSEEDLSVGTLKRELDEFKQFVIFILDQKEEEKAREKEEENKKEKEPIITTKEAAKILRLQPRTLRMYNDTMKLPGFRYTKNGPLFFKREMVLKYQKENLHHSAYFKE